MIFLLKKKTVNLFVTGIFFVGLSIGTYSFALHPNMNKWKNEQIVVTEVKTDRKAVALTFDDGPDPTNTPVLLDILKKHNVPATFFVTGIHSQEYPALVQRMALEDHEIGNHSYSHPDFNHKSNKFILNEIRKTNKIIYKLTGKQPVFFRPPGGYLSFDMVDLIRKEEMIIAYWTYQQDSKDWANTSASRIADHVIKNIKPGQIIILHDGCPNGLQTAKAVDTIIAKLSIQGYEFLTLSDLIKSADK
jgi:peptidoglycan/xylan/chitin deacetylase (PgdA/CDA1 family)